ncbi:ParB/RepB/Spo0J family partition protein [Crenobacter sp. SG2305]|uniref:ParB/RepB/Spo0J family partition protein n=1 Tax=Crenobacter oryzisoli TaxID=3056844 RepID=UPI0025AAD445|nr:ParB/RepB/Spo0J family partition protein [Crenobacter sp. SG2305]MDN0082463.1 ParB/RepB/Spo0J family partition protein [Crenobacter sp. SG2305]
MKQSRPLGTDFSPSGSIHGVVVGKVPDGNIDTPMSEVLAKVGLLNPSDQVVTTEQTEKLPEAEVAGSNLILTSDEKIELIDIDLIDEPAVRQRWLYTPEKVSKMATSIMAEGNGNPIAGQLQPVTLIPSPDTPGRYEMVDGLTRLKAFKDHYLGKKIKSIVRFDLDRSDAYRFGYMSNEERNPTSHYDKGMSFFAAIEAGLYPSKSHLAAELRISNSAVTGYLAFAKLPPSVISIIETNTDSFGYNAAGRLLALSHKVPTSEVEAAARKVANGTWSFSKLSSYVTEAESGTKKTKRTRKSSRTIRDLGKMRCGDGSLSLVLDGIPAELEKDLADRIEAIILECIGKVPPANE